MYRRISFRVAVNQRRGRFQMAMMPVERRITN
jgi:hypothetical protein